MVYVLLAPGYEEAETVVPVDLLRRAGVEVKLATLAGDAVPSSRNVQLVADCKLHDIELDKVDMLMIPGGMGGTDAIKASPEAGELIKAAAAKGAYLAAICAGPTVFAQLGLLVGKKATCHPGMEDQLTGAIPVDQRVVVDGQFITSQAAGTSFDFGYKLVEILAGPEAVEKVEKGVYYKK